MAIPSGGGTEVLRRGLVDVQSTSETTLLFTGAKTGSVYQASLSYGSNRIISKIREFDQKQSINEDYNNLNISTFNRNPIIVSDYEIPHIHSFKITN